MLSQPFTGNNLISTTETSFISGNTTLQSNTTAGVYQLFLDLSTLTAGDAFTVNVKEKIISTGSQLVIEQIVMAPAGGSYSAPGFVSAPLQLVNGWDMTIVKNQGTDRYIPYSIRQIS